MRSVAVPSARHTGHLARAGAHSAHAQRWQQASKAYSRVRARQHTHGPITVVTGRVGGGFDAKGRRLLFGAGGCLEGSEGGEERGHEESI